MVRNCSFLHIIVSKNFLNGNNIWPIIFVKMFFFQIEMIIFGITFPKDSGAVVNTP